MAVQDYLSGINQATSGAQQNVTAAAKDLSNLQVGAGSLPAKLKEALNTKLNNNADIINQQADTMGAYFNAGPQAREKYQDVFNPFQKAALVQNERTMALRPYDVLSGVLENRMGDVNDIVQSGIQGWQGLVDAGQTKLGAAQSGLQNALQSYLQAVGMQQSADTAEEAKRQFNVSTANQVDQFNRSLSQKSGGGAGGIDINKIMSMFTPIAETTNNSQLTEPMPSFTPTKTNVQYHSPAGQWNWSGEDQTWIPTRGTIHVVNKETLEDGDIPANEFDRNKYSLFQ